MSNNMKHDISVIEGKPILILKFVENITANDIEEVTDHLLSMAESIESDFCIITDLRELSSIEEESKAKISQMMQQLYEKGLKYVARVFPGGNEDAINTYIEAGSTTPYTASYFSSMEKAMEFAENMTTEPEEEAPES
jgi:hypothetical protein